MSKSSKRGRPRSILPSYRLHKSSGQAVVTIRGKTHYLGPFGSDDSRRKYGEVLAAASSGVAIDPLAKPSQQSTVGDPGPSVAVLCVAFLDFAESYYVKDGQQTDEVDCYRSLIRVLRQTHGLTSISQFGPNHLRAVRDAMIAADWSRGYINRQINRLRHMVKWAVGRDMVEPSVLERLRAVEPLTAGRSQARETRPRGSVPEASIAAVKAKIRSRKAKALIDLQLATAARPGELLQLTTQMIDQSTDVWTVSLTSHKTQHFGKSRILAFGPKAQAVLSPFLRPDAPDEPLFSIKRNTYEQIVRNACDRAGVPRFVPHELRHTGGTHYHDELGFEAARAMLGHARPDMTAHYSNNLRDKAIAAAAVLG